MRKKKTRIWDGNKMRVSEIKWEDTNPMSFSGFTDKNNKPIYENDIIEFKNFIAIVKKGNFNYNKRTLKGWYLECYDNGKKKIRPFYADEVGAYVIIGNIYKNQSLYKKLKLGRSRYDSVG